MRRNCSFVLGKGRSIRFLENQWCGEEPLSEGSPNLYRLAEKKGPLIADCWDDSRGEGAWNPIFERPLNDWELNEMWIFLNLDN